MSVRIQIIPPVCRWFKTFTNCRFSTYECAGDAWFMRQYNADTRRAIKRSANGTLGKRVPNLNYQNIEKK